MTREGALLVMIAVTLVLLGLGVWAWRRRARRDGGLSAPVGELPDGARILGAYSGLYVATTAHDAPLERLAIRGLAFRSRVDVTLAAEGVALDLPGQPRFVLPVERIASVDRATVAIDRVVERGGLVRVVWRADADTLVDTFLRPQDVTSRDLADAVAGILPAPTTPTPTGSDA